jgi:hypothetical protein
VFLGAVRVLSLRLFLYVHGQIFCQLPIGVRHGWQAFAVWDGMAVHLVERVTDSRLYGLR